MGMKKPVGRFRAGLVSCALWENEVTVKGETTVMLKATVSRRYKDKDGDWRTSESFSRSDIPLVIYVLEKAFAAMIDHASERREVPEEFVGE